MSLLELLDEEEGAQQRFLRADGRDRVGEHRHARMTKCAVRLAQPVVNDAWGNAGTAALRLRLDQRSQLSERRGHRRRPPLVIVRDRPVSSVGREQALDQRGRTAPRPVSEVKDVDRLAGLPGPHHAERLPDKVAAAPGNPCHDEGASGEVGAEGFQAPDHVSVEPGQIGRASCRERV